MGFHLIVFIVLFLSLEAFECPPDDRWGKVPGEDVCMMVNKASMSYSDVVWGCDVDGGIPVKIRNIFENAYALALTQELNGVSPYIGVHRVQELGYDWGYADGTPLEYANWAPGQPSSNGTCYCAHMDTMGQWFCDDCYVNRPSLCSFDGPTPSPTPSKAPNPCGENYAYFSKTNACYYVDDFHMCDTFVCPGWNLDDWNYAESFCSFPNRWGGDSHLVSIHSKEEEDFVFDLILSNVANETDKVPDGDPCNYSWVWIGYVGTGELGNGIPDSNWTDGSPVDYIGIPERGPGNASSLWMMVNDPSCSMKGWSWGGKWDTTGRFVCKASAPSHGEGKF